MTRPLRNTVRFVSLAQALLDEGRPVRFRAHGWSMHPAIRDGEAITVDPVRASEIAVGDILLYRNGRGVIAHRVVAIDSSRAPRRLVLRGDAASGPDAPIVDADVLGRVTAVGPRAAGSLARAVLTRLARVRAR